MFLLSGKAYSQVEEYIWLQSSWNGIHLWVRWTNQAPKIISTTQLSITGIPLEGASSLVNSSPNTVRKQCSRRVRKILQLLLDHFANIARVIHGQLLNSFKYSVTPVYQFLKRGQQGNGPKSKGIFGNLLKANYLMNLFETFRHFYWIFKLYEYFFVKYLRSRFISCRGPVTYGCKEFPLTWITAYDETVLLK